MPSEGEPTSAHGVVITLVKGKLAISCKCYESNPFGTHGRPIKVPPMGVTTEWRETVKLYNDPDNHLVPFTDKDKLRGPL